MPSFIALFPAILILSLILYAVVDSDRVDQAQQRALGSEVVLVALEVFSKVADTVGKQRDLALGRTRVGVRLAVLAEKLLLFLCC